MPSYDSIVVGEDWISEHYFTTDSTKESFQGKVLELRKQWDAEAAEGRETVRRDMLAAAGELQTALSTLEEHPEGAAYAHALTRRTLGFTEELTDYIGERAGTQLRLPTAQLAGITRPLFLQAAAVTSIDDLLDPRLARAVRRYLAHSGGDCAQDLYRLVLAEVEAPMLRETLRHTDGNLTRAADMLGITRATLRKKLAEHRLG